MVATAGPGWKLALSLVALVDEADRLWPGRDHSSDGSIGNAEHAARDSDHNPRDGWVHAVDLDEDLAPGLDLRAFAEFVRSRRDPRVRYVIYEGRILKAYPSSSGPAWTWSRYDGPNAHATHLHVSIDRTPAARADTSSWFQQEAPMTPTQEAKLDKVLAMLSKFEPPLIDPNSGMYGKTARIDETIRGKVLPALADLARALEEIQPGGAPTGDLNVTGTLHLS